VWELQRHEPRAAIRRSHVFPAHPARETFYDSVIKNIFLEKLFDIVFV
jgi:hypothetical protein